MSGVHDSLAKAAFNLPEHAAAEFRAVLPAALVEAVDWNTLRPGQPLVVDTGLKQKQNDLVFSARLKTGEPVEFLLEHQSDQQPHMALRVLVYLARHYERWYQEHPGKKLPVLIPVVLYHGPEGPWRAPTSFEELLRLPEDEQVREALLRYVPRMSFSLDDLMALAEEALKARDAPAFVLMVLLMMRHGRSGGLARWLRSMVGLLQETYASAGGQGWLETLLAYALELADEQERTDLRVVMHRVTGAQKTEERMATIADAMRRELRDEVRAQVRDEVRAEGRAETLLHLLNVKGIRVSARDRQRILACTDIPTLDRWLERVLTATTLQQVLGGQ